MSKGGSSLQRTHAVTCSCAEPSARRLELGPLQSLALVLPEPSRLLKDLMQARMRRPTQTHMPIWLAKCCGRSGGPPNWMTSSARRSIQK